MSQPRLYPWVLSQEHVDRLASALIKLEALLDIASPGTIAGRERGLLADGSAGAGCDGRSL